LLLDVALDHFQGPGINGGDKHAAPIFWTKDNMVFAVVYDRPVSVQAIGGHRDILTTNICSVNLVRGFAAGLFQSRIKEQNDLI
jgi:hypothetical protein